MLYCCAVYHQKSGLKEARNVRIDDDNLFNRVHTCN